MVKGIFNLKDAECERNEATAFETGKTEAGIECQQKLKGIKEKIEGKMSRGGTPTPFGRIDTLSVSEEDWAAFWKEEGI